MDLPVNTFLRSLLRPDAQYGMFVTIPDATVAEIAATAGCDWILLDAEHGTGEPATVLAQVRAIEARGIPVLVRVPSNDPRQMRPFLDAGVLTLVVPMVETPDAARAAAQAVTYPPAGIRGVAATRAAGWGGVVDYYARARDEICLVVQVESRRTLGYVREIADVDGVDAILIGPSDLAASLGHLGDPHHPEVMAAVTNAIVDARTVGVPVGVFASRPEGSKQYREAGASFIACGLDGVMMARAFRDVLTSYRDA